MLHSLLENAMEKSLVDGLSIRVDRLEQECVRLRRQARRWKRIGGAVLIAATTLFVASDQERITSAQQPDKKNDSRGEDRRNDPTVLYEDQLKLAQKTLSIIDQATRRGIPALDQAQQEHFWSVRTLEAEIYLSLRGNEPKAGDPQVFLSIPGIEPDANRLAAFDAHLRRMKSWEEKLKGAAQRGAISVLDIKYAEFRRLQAEIWLAREKLKKKDKPEQEKKDK
jgi:hypothetical protein